MNNYDKKELKRFNDFIKHYKVTDCELRKETITSNIIIIGGKSYGEKLTTETSYIYHVYIESIQPRKHINQNELFSFSDYELARNLYENIAL